MDHKKFFNFLESFNTINESHNTLIESVAAGYELIYLEPITEGALADTYNKARELNQFIFKSPIKKYGSIIRPAMELIKMRKLISDFDKELDLPQPDKNKLTGIHRDINNILGNIKGDQHGEKLKSQIADELNLAIAA